MTPKGSLVITPRKSDPTSSKLAMTRTLDDSAEKCGLNVQYENLGKIAYGYTAPGEEITLSTEDWDVFFHELAHNAQKKIDGEIKRSQDPEQGTIAQLSAAVLARIYGRNAGSFTYNYIAHYAGSKSPEQVGRMCLCVLSKVQKVLALILGTHAGSEKEDSTSGVKQRWIA